MLDNTFPAALESKSFPESAFSFKVIVVLVKARHLSLLWSVNTWYLSTLWSVNKCCYSNQLRLVILNTESHCNALEGPLGGFRPVYPLDDRSGSQELSKTQNGGNRVSVAFGPVISSNCHGFDCAPIRVGINPIGQVDQYFYTFPSWTKTGPCTQQQHLPSWCCIGTAERVKAWMQKKDSPQLVGCWRTICVNTTIRGDLLDQIRIFF